MTVIAIALVLLGRGKNVKQYFKCNNISFNQLFALFLCEWLWEGELLKS